MTGARLNKLFLVCLMLAPLAHAAKWVKVGSGAGTESYIDSQSIIQSNGSYKVWSLVSHASLQHTPDGTPYRSLKALHLYSCQERTTTLKSQVFYPEPMGKGQITASFKYEQFSAEDIIPDSPADGALQVVCKTKKAK